jgi:hypothetical protein
VTITSHPDNPTAPTEALAKIAEGEQIPTLQWVQDRLGISKYRVMSLVRRGRLSQPKFLSRPGDHVSLLVFDAREVLALRSKVTPSPPRTYTKKYRGTTLINWSKVFRALRDGMSFAELVITFDLSPANVRRIKTEYDAGFTPPPSAPEAPATISPMRRAWMHHEENKLRLEEAKLQVKERTVVAQERLLALQRERIDLGRQRLVTRERLEADRNHARRFVAVMEGSGIRKGGEAPPE